VFWTETGEDDMTTIDEMWAALEAHKPKRSYAKAWRVMCRERTEASAWEAYHAAPYGSAAWAAAIAAAEVAWAIEHHAQEAIDALREVKP
jgi:hypothetical protein